MTHFSAEVPVLRSMGLLVVVFVALMLSSASATAQSVLVDNFNRANNNTVGNGWTEFHTAAPASVRVESNQMRMNSATAGRDYASKPTPGTYNTVLDSNRFVMQWAFSMRQTNTDPSGFNNGQLGCAVVLAGSNANLLSGVGYAIVLGNAGAVDPLRLVRYSGGLSTNASLTDIISFGDFAQNFLAVRVLYDPNTGIWEVYYTDDGIAGGFVSDPLAAATLGGTAANTVHTTTLLPYVGALWNHGTASGNTAYFDNIHVPQDISTSFSFIGTSAVVDSDAGTHTLTIGINNPDPVLPMSVDVVLLSGNAGAVVGGYTTQTLVFPAASAAPQQLILDVRKYGGCAGDELLTFGLDNIVGGLGAPYVGYFNTYTLQIQDRSNFVVSHEESFETDGSGTRYTLSAAHGTGGGGYFLRSTPGTFSGLGSPLPTSVDGTSLIGGMNIGALAADAEVTLTITGVDILGLSSVNVALLIGARAGNFYDNAVALRDYLFVDVNVDGGGWNTVGAFRSKAPGLNNSQRFAQDTDLNGVGDGPDLTPALSNVALPVGTIGGSMDIRIRFRTNDLNEEIYFDRVRVQGQLCRPIYYSRSGGNVADPIWSLYSDGVAGSATFDRNASALVQAGHVVQNNGDWDLWNAYVDAGGDLRMGPDEVRIHGDRINANGLFRGGGTLSLVGSGPVALDGSATYGLFNLTNACPGGVVANANVNVRGTLQLDEGDLEANGVVRLVSNALSMGRLGVVAPGATYTGDLTVERYIPGGATNWRLLASPVSGRTVFDWSDDFVTSGFPGSNFPGFTVNGDPWPSVRWYDETDIGASIDDGLIGVSNINQALLTGQGFAVWCGDALGGTSPFTLDVAGPPTIGLTPLTLPMTWTNTGQSSVDGWNLVANPLPSPIDFTAIVRGADVPNSYWIYDPASGNNATWSNGFGVNGANGVIQTSQGFWLKAIGGNVTTTVSEAAKIDDNTGGFFGGLEQPSAPMVRLTVSSAINTFKDEALIVFAGGSPQFGDAEGDARKFSFAHPEAPQISTKSSDDQELAISMYGSYSNAIQIPVLVAVAVSGQYTISASDMVQMNGLSCLTLEDVLTGVNTPLVDGASYSFQIDANTLQQEPRFFLRATQPVDLALTSVSCSGALDGQASIFLLDPSTDLVWSNAAGNVILAQSGIGPGNTVVTDLAPGAYMVTITSNTACGTLTTEFSIGEPSELHVEAAALGTSCFGSSDGSILATANGGTAPYSFLWSNGSNEQSQSDVPAGAYSVTVTDLNGCEGIFDQIVVEEPGPIEGEIVAPMSVPTNEAVVFSSTASENLLHTWDFGSGNVVLGATAEYSFALPGDQLVILTLSDGECTRSIEHVVSVFVTTGLDVGTDNGFRVWSNGNALVVLNNEGLSGTMRVFDVAGRIVATAPLIAGEQRMELEAEWPWGVYHVELMTTKGRWTTSVPVGN